MTERYLVAFGSNPEFKGCFFMQGPQAASEIPSEVKSLLARSGVKEVAVVGDYGIGVRIAVYRALPDDLASERKEDGT